MKKILTLLLTITLLLTTIAFAEPSLETSSFPIVKVLTPTNYEGVLPEPPPIVLEECEPFEIDGYEVLELAKISFNVEEEITAQFSFVTEFTGNEQAMICFETGGGLECWIFEDAIFENNTVILTFEEDLIAAASKDDTYLAIAKIVAVG